MNKTKPLLVSGLCFLLGADLLHAATAGLAPPPPAPTSLSASAPGSAPLSPAPASASPSVAAPAPAAGSEASASIPGTSIAPSASSGIRMPGEKPAPNPNNAATLTPVELIDPALFGTVQDPSFENMTTKLFPMSPEQIQSLHQVYESTQAAISAPAASPKPMLSSQTVPLSPGSVPPVIRLATGYVTSILFVDETGMPWPITAYNIGDPKAFNVQWDQTSNLLMIQGHVPFATGNMAITLDKLATPMMFTLVSDQRVVDYRIDFRLQGRGPNASTSLANNNAQNGSALLMNLLDGVAPSDARALEVVGGGAQAWLRGSTLFLRTPLTVLSPSWDATMSSADGTKVYQMQATPLILVSDRGRSTTITIKGL